jgi:glutamate synthase domain-containing protein 2
MIELKISQGAKPGHGGMLPGEKVDEEIASIRGVEVGKDVFSPAKHSAFSTPIELMQFIQKLRDLSGGKPVGFKTLYWKETRVYVNLQGHARDKDLSRLYHH